MTRDEIIRMAREAGFSVHERKRQARVGIDELLGIDSTEKLERFAELAAASEREACAKVCDHYATAIDLRGNEYIRSGDCKRAAELIRNRK